MAASPYQWGHQIAWLIAFLALPVLVGATVLLLVVLPALDTLSAGQVGLCCADLMHSAQHLSTPAIVSVPDLGMSKCFMIWCSQLLQKQGWILSTTHGICWQMMYSRVEYSPCDNLRS